MMNTRELIALLKKKDPTGDAEAVLFAVGAGYVEVEGAWKLSLVKNVRKRGNDFGEHMEAGDYEHSHPHGKKQPVAALVLTCHPG